VGGTFIGLTSGESALSDCGKSGRSPEVVYQWTPATSGDAVIDTCGIDTLYDTVLYVRQDDCSSGPSVVCNDDAAGCAVDDGTPNGGRHGSRVQPRVTAGVTYFIVVDGYRGAQGQYSLTVTPPGVSGAPSLAPAVEAARQRQGAHGGRGGSSPGGSSGGSEGSSADPSARQDSPDKACLAVSCDARGGCERTSLPDGSPCQTDDPCALGVCAAGQCGAVDTTSAAGRPLDLQMSQLALRGTGKRGRVIARGVFSAPTAIDPTMTGVTIEVRAPNDSLLYEARIPAARFRASRGQTVFRYVGMTTSGAGATEAQGIRRMLLAVRGDRVGVQLTATAPELADAVHQPGLTCVLRLGTVCARDRELVCSGSAGIARCGP